MRWMHDCVSSREVTRVSSAEQLALCIYGIVSVGRESPLTAYVLMDVQHSIGIPPQLLEKMNMSLQYNLSQVLMNYIYDIIYCARM